jgi:hypothetical protein
VQGEVVEMASDRNEFQWQGKPVRVTARSVLRTLGLTASIDVEVGGQVVLATGGKFRMSDVDTTHFNDASGTHVVELRWRAVPRSMIGVRTYTQPFEYRLRLDGDVVAESTIEFNYFPAELMMTLAVGAVLMFWLQHAIGVQFQDAAQKLGAGKKF